MSIQITINEQTLSLEKGMTILQAARLHGIYIPTLCDFPGLPSHGSCRMCLVEIEGRPNTPTACTTPVEEGMRIHTTSPKVQALRSEILQMLLSEHPSGCLFCQEKDHCDECMVTLRKAGVTTGCGSCPKDEQCTLQEIVQEMVQKTGLSSVGYPIHYRMLPVDKYDPFFDRDYNLCVLCGRCIRVCGELHFNNVLTYTSRGTQTLVGTAFHRTHLEAGCSFCGACVEVCPTGALSEKTRKWDGKPDRETASTCPLCSIACSIRVLSKNERVIGSLPGHAAGMDALCVKGRFGIPELVNHPTRLKTPQKREVTGPLEITWDEAILTAAEKLTTCDPVHFRLRVSPNCTNETLYVAQKFAREVMRLGARNTPEADDQTALSRGAGPLIRQSEPLSILSEASAILCIGLDGTYAQSVAEVRLHQAKKRGAQIISIHPEKHRLSPYADEWLRPSPGEEAGLINSLVEMFARELPSGRPPASPVERAAGILRTASSTAVIVGPDCLSQPEDGELLEAIERLVQVTGARVITLPNAGNLVGSLLLGGFSPESDGKTLDVLYLVGEDIPEHVPGDPFILYQNIYPPSGSRPADLAMPTAAFTEEEGSSIDYSGGVQQTHPAVQPPGQALPSWQILCRIAQAMGASGFDYENAADIQAEIATKLPGFQAKRRIHLSDVAQFGPAPAALPAHHYLGFPLSRWVEGLRSLYSEEEILDTDYRDKHG